MPASRRRAPAKRGAASRWVASEVRALAQRSAEAAREIKALISTSSQQVGEGVKLVGETGTALTRIAAQVAQISGVVMEIAAFRAGTSDRPAGGQHRREPDGPDDAAERGDGGGIHRASHALAKEAEELARLTDQFQLAQDSNVEALRPRRPVPAPRPAKPARSGGAALARKPRRRRSRLGGVLK